MKRRSVILLICIIAIPLATLIWAVNRMAEQEQVVVEKRFQDVYTERLNDVNKYITLFFDDASRDLDRITSFDQANINELRRINRSEPRLMQLFVMNEQGGLIYPDPTQGNSLLNANERIFLIEAAKMFTGQDLKDSILRQEKWVNRQPQPDAAQGNLPPQVTPNSRSRTTRSSNWQRSINSNQAAQQKAVADAYQNNNAWKALPLFKEANGWFTWYWDRGINVIYWQRRPSGNVVGAALDRSRWLADLIAQLPDTVEAAKGPDTVASRIRLVNTSGDAVYQWGSFEPAKDARPFCEVPVAAPLKAWRLECFVPVKELTAGSGQSTKLSLFAVIAAVAALLGVCGFLFLKDYARDMKQATQQVSFVNQVSHELKTPLTNIRMYAELLDDDLQSAESDFGTQPRERLQVILSEGQRLSRLIGNVLTFARQQRKTLKLQPQQVVPDELIGRIVERFRPALEDLQLQVSVEGRGGHPMQIDPDFVEQILGNLISNVEKYAAAGGELTICLSQDNSRLTIDVIDAGPGIPPAKQDEIFRPFARLSNNVSYAAGTGIGLSIARDLARQHGGDLTLQPSETGCHFRITLQSQNAP